MISRLSWTLYSDAFLVISRQGRNATKIGGTVKLLYSGVIICLRKRLSSEAANPHGGDPRVDLLCGPCISKTTKLLGTPSPYFPSLKSKRNPSSSRRRARTSLAGYLNHCSSRPIAASCPSRIFFSLSSVSPSLLQSSCNVWHNERHAQSWPGPWRHPLHRQPGPWIEHPPARPRDRRLSCSGPQRGWRVYTQCEQAKADQEG